MFTTRLFGKKKKLKQVSAAFSSFDLQSPMEINSFLLDANTRVYFGSRNPKLVSLLFSTSTSCTKRKATIEGRYH